MLIRVRPAINDEHARERLAELVRIKKEAFADLSRWLGRSPSYLRRYVVDSVPKRLPDRERRALAGYFGVDECELGTDAPVREPFGSWLLAQRGRNDAVGDLAVIARIDRELPRDGAPDQIRERLLRRRSGGIDWAELSALVEQAEQMWRGQMTPPGRGG